LPGKVGRVTAGRVGNLYLELEEACRKVLLERVSRS
jgi:hypothetical protein